MDLKTDKLLLHASLVDQMLDELSPISTFMKQEEYQKVYDYVNTLKSKKWFLDANFFKPINLPKKEDILPFSLKLYTDSKSQKLSDSLAIIPYEFQYIKKDLPEFDVIIIRMSLDSKSYRIATMEVSEDVINSFEIYFKQVLNEKPNEDSSNIFDEACFLCVKEYIERIIRTKGVFYQNWNSFRIEFKKKHNKNIQDYSDIGKYLWQTDFLRFDNRYRKHDKITTLVEQLENYKKQEENKNTEKNTRKKPFSSIKSFFEK